MEFPPTKDNIKTTATMSSPFRSDDRKSKGGASTQLIAPKIQTTKVQNASSTQSAKFSVTFDFLGILFSGSVDLLVTSIESDYIDAVE